MQVPLLDLRRQHESIQADLDRALKTVFAHCQFIMGPEVTQFESEVAAFCGCKYAVGVASGTDALLIALRGCEVGPGDEVITSTFSFFASAGVVSRLGAKPVLVDIDPATFNLDPNLVERAITPRTKVIMPVHLFGQCADMAPLLDIARRHQLFLVEDAAQAIGALYKGRNAGSMGDYGCFSFFPSKNLGGIGDGGMIVSNRVESEVFLRKLREHGAHPKYYHSHIGYNSRLDTLQAAALSIKLRHLKEWTDGRRRNARFYTESLRGLPLRTPQEQPGNYHIYNQYTLAVPSRDKLVEHLKSQQIGHALYYPVPLHAQECYRFLGHQPGDLPHAERAAAEVLSIPIFPELTEAERQYVVDSVTQHFRT